MTTRATGEFIQEKLELLSNQVGIPEQILGGHRRCAFGEHGSNLKKGIELYQKNHPEVIYTYDVTHAMSNLLKQYLSKDETYRDFIESCHKCRLKLQQTPISFFSTTFSKKPVSLF